MADDDDGLAPVTWLRPAGTRPSSSDGKAGAGADVAGLDWVDAEPSSTVEAPIPFPRRRVDDPAGNAGSGAAGAAGATGAAGASKGGRGEPAAVAGGWGEPSAAHGGWGEPSSGTSARGDASRDDSDADDDSDSDDAASLDQAQIEKISLGALTRRGVSSRELHRVLIKRGVEPEAADAEVERLERVGLLDDTALAETLVRTLRDRKGLGKSALKAELGRRLIDSVAIEAALDETDADDEAARAREVAMKRAPQLRSLEREVAVRRLTAFLMRKGYSGGVVRTAVDTALGGYRPRGNPSSVRFE